MSGAVKAGLIYGAIGMVAVIVTALIPGPGSVVCGPVLAVIVGAAAGYYALRWSPAGARVGSGVLAGALAGLGLLIGAVVAYIMLFNNVSANPLFQEQVQEMLRQQPDAQIDPAGMRLAVQFAGVVAGLCFGVLNLLLALAFGALGGWLVVRNRPPAPPNGQDDKMTR